MLEKGIVPILEFDGNSRPIVTPQAYNEGWEPGRKIEHCIITYFSDVVESLERGQKINQVFRLRFEGYRPRVYEMKTESGKWVYVMIAPVGAPQAARIVECLANVGVKKFMVCGGGGTFFKNKTGKNVLVPVSAVRDEGTSYHYLPPSREVQMNPKVLEIIRQTLTNNEIRFLEVKTWSTDAIFRETADKVALRKSEGCDVVEMECSAYYSVAQALGLMCGQLLYAGDSVEEEEWDYRGWHTRFNKRMFMFDCTLKCLLNL